MCIYCAGRAGVCGSLVMARSDGAVDRAYNAGLTSVASTAVSHCGVSRGPLATVHCDLK